MSTIDLILIAAIITAWAATAAIIWGNYTSAKTRDAIYVALGKLAARKAEIEAVEAHIWELVREYREVNVTIYRPDDEKECEAVEIRPYREKEAK